jgi:hypothetical protein
MPETTQFSDTKRALLSQYLRGCVSPSPMIGARPPGTTPPLSLVQEPLYLRELRLGGNPPIYNECITIRMQGSLDVDVLERSFHEIVRRHEAWRTSFETKAGGPIQIIHPEMFVPFAKFDLHGMGEAEVEAEAFRLVSDEVRRPFQLNRPPLLRPILVRTGTEEHRLFLVAHQIIVDGKSAYQIYPSELAALYKAFSEYRSSPLPELEIQFADFAYWQREWFEEQREKQILYWRKELGGDLAVSTWPMERPATSSSKFQGNIQPFSFSQQLSERMRETARRLNSTLFLTLLSGLATVIHRQTREDRVVLGTLSPSGRKRSEVMGLLGYFLNPIALRLNCGIHKSFSELLSDAGKVVYDAMSNDVVPIEYLARELGANEDCDPHPFFNAAISLQPSMPDVGLPWSVTTMDVTSGGSPWPFYIAFIDRPEGIAGRVQFNPFLLETDTVESVLDDLQHVFEAVCLK